MRAHCPTVEHHPMMLLDMQAYFLMCAPGKPHPVLHNTPWSDCDIGTDQASFSDLGRLMHQYVPDDVLSSS
jgi:hypothetical protein